MKLWRRAGGGWQTELPCLFKSLFCTLLVVTLIWLTSPQIPLSPPLVGVSRIHHNHPPSLYSYLVLHQWRATSKINRLTISSTNPSSFCSLSFPLLALSIPISLPLNGLSVPPILRRVLGVIPAPQLLWMVLFWMFTLCDRLLYIPTVLIRCAMGSATGDWQIFHRFTKSTVRLKTWRNAGLWRNATCIGQIKSIAVQLPGAQLENCYGFLRFLLLEINSLIERE